MKRSTWSLAGVPALMIAIASGPGLALDAEKPADRGCVGARALPGGALVEDAPERRAFFPASSGGLKKSPYFSIDKRHRQSWWRSASRGLRGH